MTRGELCKCLTGGQSKIPGVVCNTESLLLEEVGAGSLLHSARGGDVSCRGPPAGERPGVMALWAGGLRKPAGPSRYPLTAS